MDNVKWEKLYEDALSARKRSAEILQPTPLIKLYGCCNGSNCQNTNVFLKLENLQPLGSFKVRGAYNVVCNLSDEQKRLGVWSASRGNFAQGLSWVCSQEDIKCTVVVPHDTPKAKIEPAEKLGAKIVHVSDSEWFKIIFENPTCPQVTGTFVHPAFEYKAIAGNAVIGLEILEQLADIDAIIIPFGGGGLTLGVAACVRHRKPDVRVYVAEVETAAPLTASLRAGEPVKINYQPSFVDGIGSTTVSADIFHLVKKLVEESIVVSLEEIKNAVRLLARRNHVIAEGAGAASVAAALSGKAGSGNIVCLVSGGCINSSLFCELLQCEGE